MTVCYFTGSGNCLYVARRIGGTLLSIPQLMRQESIEIADEAVRITPITKAQMVLYQKRLARRWLRKDTALSYTVNDSCIHYGVCVKVCPANNITVTKDFGSLRGLLRVPAQLPAARDPYAAGGGDRPVSQRTCEPAGHGRGKRIRSV